MPPSPKGFDPRRTSIAAYVNARLDAAEPHANQEAVLKILRGRRDTAALTSISRLLPGRPGLAYDPESTGKRAAQRVGHALKAMRDYGCCTLKTVLDVGCARAESVQALEAAGVRKYIGLDVDRTHFPDAGATRMSTEFIQASAETMPLQDDSIDLAFSFNVFEHLATPANALREIVRVLRPGAVFYTRFGPPFNAASGPHLTRYVDLPYLQHLFPEGVVAGFTGRTSAYQTVNRLPLHSYRDLFFNEDGYRLVRYREEVNERGFWILRNLPELREAHAMDELAVCAVAAVIVKPKESGPLGRLRAAVRSAMRADPPRLRS